MNIKCASCQTALKLDETKYTEEIVIIQCPKCDQKIRVKFPQPQSGIAPPLVVEEREVAHDTTQAAVIKPQRLFKAPFLFKGRIRRLEYGLSAIASMITIAIIETMMTDEYGELMDDYDKDTGRLLFMLIVTVTWFTAAQSTKRCHDLGRSGWYQLIPFYGLFLLFQNGQKNANEYGDPVK